MSVRRIIPPNLREYALPHWKLPKLCGDCQGFETNSVRSFRVSVGLGDGQKFAVPLTRRKVAATKLEAVSHVIKLIWLQWFVWNRSMSFAIFQVP